MSEPKPVYYDGIYTDGTCYISSDIPTTTDQPDPTYITALNLRIDALCAEVGRLRGALQEIVDYPYHAGYPNPNTRAIAEKALE